MASAVCVCGTEFKKGYPTQRFCSRNCARLHTNTRWKVPVGYVPGQPVIDEVLRFYQVGDDQLGHFERRADISRGYITNYLNKKKRFMSFQVADKIICALGDVTVWNHPELREHYLTCDLNAPRAYMSETATKARRGPGANPDKSPLDKKKVISLWEGGLTIDGIAKRLGVKRGRIGLIVQKHRKERDDAS